MDQEFYYSSLDRDDVEQRLLASSRNRRKEKNSQARSQQAWHGTAFVLEVVVLVFFLALSLAVLVSMFGTAHQTGQKSIDKTNALILATTASPNGAEGFAADPTADVPDTLYFEYVDGAFEQRPIYTSGVYTVVRQVTSEPAEAGTLYKATIMVTRHKEAIYTMVTERYVSGRGA